MFTLRRLKFCKPSNSFANMFSNTTDLGLIVFLLAASSLALRRINLYYYSRKRLNLLLMSPKEEVFAVLISFLIDDSGDYI